jgi:hypothetical protein
MPVAKKYFQDKIILSLLSLNLFVVILVFIVIALRISANSTEGYIVQYRSDLGIGAFKTGSVFDFIYIIIFAVFAIAFHFILSYRTYHIHRQLSIVLLSMSILLLTVALIVSNALLVLR